MHAVGLVFAALSAGSILLGIGLLPCTNSGEYVAAVIYVVSLLTVLSISLVLQPVADLTPVEMGAAPASTIPPSTCSSPAPIRPSSPSCSTTDWPRPWR
jgi:hypothetical protein